MSAPALKLTVHVGERDRIAGGPVADALMATFARHRLRTSVLLRGRYELVHIFSSLRRSLC